jgi:hypothetical protein
MRKLLLQILVFSPVILTFYSIAPKSAITQEIDRTINASTPTNVSQSADIAPSSWAFQALLSLAKRYSCPIVAPVGTTLGDRTFSLPFIPPAIFGYLLRSNQSFDRSFHCQVHSEVA